jgi:putative protease
LTIVVCDDAGHEVRVAWDRVLEPAQKYPLSEQLFREQFGRMGDSPFVLAHVRGLEDSSQAMVPKSVLNDLRRQAVQQLLELRERRGERVVRESETLEAMRSEIALQFPSHAAPPDQWEGEAPAGPNRSNEDRLGGSVALPYAIDPQTDRTCRLHVLVRTLDQLKSVIEWRSTQGANLASVYCDFEDIRKYKEAVTTARQAGIPIGLATIRIIKPGEEGLLKQVADGGSDFVLVRNLAGLSWFATNAPQTPLVADYSLNAANELTAAIMAEQGVMRMVPSYDLNWTEMAAMLKRFPPEMFEAVIHQHMPMFHMEHCVFCHTLSTGTSYRDCGRPCDTHKVELKDRAGAAHPLVADVGCRNTVFNAAAQSAAEFVPRMKEMGLRDFRVELLRQDATQVGPLLDQYARVLAGSDDGRRTWSQLRVLNQLGLTRGTLAD